MSAAHFTQSAEFLARALAGVGLKQKLSLVILEEEDYRVTAPLLHANAVTLPVQHNCFKTGACQTKSH